MVWRSVHGVTLCYLLLLIWLLFHSPAQARAFMKHFDETLGVPLEERSYGDNCALILPDNTINWSVSCRTDGHTNSDERNPSMVHCGICHALAYPLFSAVR